MIHLPPAIRRFVKYSTVGVATLSFDLLLLTALTQLVHVPYTISTPLAFLVAVTVNYLISRAIVFGGTQQPLYRGYAYFLCIALVGAGAITLSVYLLVTYLGLYYLVARVAVAGVVGVGNYLSNLHLNFKVAGIHH
jgi:putative flippase GtrA